jgi:hypothetical protein
VFPLLTVCAQTAISVISGFRRDADEICTLLLGYNAASSGIPLPLEWYSFTNRGVILYHSRGNPLPLEWYSFTNRGVILYHLRSNPLPLEWYSFTNRGVILYHSRGIPLPLEGYSFTTRGVFLYHSRLCYTPEDCKTSIIFGKPIISLKQILCSSVTFLNEPIYLLFRV